MGGDLNLKKSWHPVLMSNQRKVWEQQSKALEERKKTDALLKERAEERQMEELQRMEEAVGGKTRLGRMDWMYSGPAAGEKGTTEEMEGYLLGKRRLDGLIKKDVEEKKDVASNGSAANVVGMGVVAPNARDIAAKLKEDPLLAIKNRELSIVQAGLQERERATKRRAEKEAKRGKERGHRHHRHHERSRSPRRRSDGYRDDYDRRQNSHHRHHHRTRSYSRSASRSRSPPPRRRRGNDSSDSRSRSPLPQKDSRYRDRQQGRRSGYRGFSRSRSQSPRRSNGGKYRNGDSHETRYRQRSPLARTRSPPRKTSDEQDERARKLAAMQAHASSMEDERRQRLNDADRKDEKDHQDNERGRSEKGRFVGDLRRKELDRISD